MNFNWKNIAIPLAGLAVIAFAWQAYGWGGVAVAAGGILMWLLLHFTRTMHVLKQASSRPIGYVGSAVMLNARLKPKSTLMHVMAMTHSLGEALSQPEQQPEVFRWTDPGGSSVTCEFMEGRLVKWVLDRPPPPDDEVPAAAAAEPAPPGH